MNRILLNILSSSYLSDVKMNTGTGSNSGLSLVRFKVKLSTRPCTKKPDGPVKYQTSGNLSARVQYVRRWQVVLQE